MAKTQSQGQSRAPRGLQMPAWYLTETYHLVFRGARLMCTKGLAGRIWRTLAVDVHRTSSAPLGQGETILHVLQREKTWQRACYSRTQICVWRVTPATCQPGTQIVDEASEVKPRVAARSVLGSYPVTRPLSSEPCGAPGASRPRITLLYLLTHFWV